jgi:catechol 2,3-dioxygenase-like lactoylglutathione lyase family enzyme
MTNGIAYVSIGVADMQPVSDLWLDALGLEIVAQRSGPDAELGKLWDLPAEQFVEQLLVRTPGAATGYLHFVQFQHPADAVRKDAALTDLGAKNIDVNCVGMPALVEKLKAAGYVFRSDIGEYEVDEIRAREVQLPSHDGVNVVFIEVLSEGFEVDYSPKGFAALTSFVVIVPDTQIESRFYQQIFAYDEIMHHRISGPGIEKAAGLPKGTALDLCLLGSPDNLFGRMELIEYAGLRGDNRFESAVPPATGILCAGFRVDSLDEFVVRAEQQGVKITRTLEVDAIFGKGRMVELISPAGLKLQVQ